MLGRKDYTKKEVTGTKKVVDKQLAAYKKLTKAVDATSDPKAKAALADFEPLFFNNMVLALDRPFVHRLRMVTGKDTTPLNEVELLTASLIDGSILTDDTVIKYDPDRSVVGLAVGDRIELTAAQFERLAKAFFADLQANFVK
jgi:hypothetical protein